MERPKIIVHIEDGIINSVSATNTNFELLIVDEDEMYDINPCIHHYEFGPDHIISEEEFQKEANQPVENNLENGNT